MSDIVERLREALDAVQNFRGDLDSDDFNDACAGLRFHAAQAAPVLLAELDRLRAQVAALSAPAPAPAEPQLPGIDWPALLRLINAYSMHFADAAQHRAASRADISHAAALKALTDIRMALAAHTSRWQALVHELIWRAAPAAPAAPAGDKNA